jgi:hypothetical protein
MVPYYHNSTYSWWIPIVPALLVSIIIIWQLYMQYFQLSRTSQISLLSVFSVIMSFVVSEMSKYGICVFIDIYGYILNGHVSI